MQFLNKNENKRGFTLIELLVVIAIISLLSSVVFASLNTARGKARDSQRVQSIRSVQNALELFFSDNGYYPHTTSTASPNNSDVLLSTDATIIAALTPKYISKLPTDPTNNCSGVTCGYHYYNEVSPSSAVNSAVKYSILIPYEKKAACYICGGTYPNCSTAGNWSIAMCQ